MKGDGLQLGFGFAIEIPRLLERMVENAWEGDVCSQSSGMLV